MMLPSPGATYCIIMQESAEGNVETKSLFCLISASRYHGELRSASEWL